MSTCLFCDDKVGLTNSTMYGKNKSGDKICGVCTKHLVYRDIQAMNTFKKSTTEEFLRSISDITPAMENCRRIKSKAKEIGFLWKKEVNMLCNVMLETEVLEAGVSGMIDGNLAIIAATNQRIIFLDKKLVGSSFEDYPYSKISSIAYETGLLMGKIKIHTSSNVSEIKRVAKTDAMSFVNKVREVMEANSISNTQTTVVSQESVMDQLKKLGELKSLGILSESEFEDQKTKLLARL